MTLKGNLYVNLGSPMPLPASKKSYSQAIPPIKKMDFFFLEKRNGLRENT